MHERKNNPAYLLFTACSINNKFTLLKVQVHSSYRYVANLIHFKPEFVS